MKIVFDILKDVMEIENTRKMNWLFFILSNITFIRISCLMNKNRSSWQMNTIIVI